MSRTPSTTVLKTIIGDPSLTLGAVVPAWSANDPASSRCYSTPQQTLTAGLLAPSVAHQDTQIKQLVEPQPECLHPFQLIGAVPPPMVLGVLPPTVNGPASADCVGSVHWDLHGLGNQADDQLVPGTNRKPSASPHSGITKITGRKKRVQHVVRSADESNDDGHGARVEKRYACPVEGCVKSYKQANGLKYHLK